VSNGGLIKLSDFGSARQGNYCGENQADLADESVIGTPYFMAPEVLRSWRFVV
jgi:serine/threonine protein kinase